MMLFEYFWSVVTAGVLLGLLLLVRGTLVESRAGARRGLWVLILTAVWGTASALIVTPREQIIELCRSLARIADEGDIRALGALLADDFRSQELARDEWLSQAADILTRTRLDHVRLRGVEVEWAGPRSAFARFNATCNVRTADGFGSHVATRWKLHFVRANERWLLRAVESIPVPPLFLRNPLEPR